MKQKAPDLKSQMLSDAMIILSSVSFLEKEILKKTGELEEAVNNGIRDDADRIEKELNILIKKIGNENLEMDKFLNKYKKEVENEKKAILSNFKQKK
jgi:asparagine synthetase A